MKADRFTTDDGVGIAWYEWLPEVDAADGRPVLLQHGYIANAHLNWELSGVVDAFVGAGRRVIAPDARGHGDSDKPHDVDMYGESRMATDLMQLVDLVGVDSYDLVGYSMGGVISVITATRDPRLRHLVVGGIGAGIIDFGGVDRRSFDRTALADALDSGATPPTGNDGVDSFIGFIDSVGGDRVALACQARASHSTPIPLDRITAQTLVMVGSEDDLAVEPERLAGAIPGAVLKVVTGDHLGTILDPVFTPTAIDFTATGRLP